MTQQLNYKIICDCNFFWSHLPPLDYINNLLLILQLLFYKIMSLLIILTIQTGFALYSFEKIKINIVPIISGWA